MVRSAGHPSRSASVSLHSGPGSPPLDIQVTYRFGVPLVYVSGEIGHDTKDQLRRAIDQELINRPGALLLECSQVAYIDSGGLSLLFETVQKMKDIGRLAIVSPREQVRRLAELTGLTDQPGFRIIDDLAAVPGALAEPKA